MSLIIILFYGIMAVMGAVLVATRVGESPLFTPYGFNLEGSPLHLAVAILLIIVTHLLTRLSDYSFRTVRRAARDIARYFEPFSHWQLLLIAAMSGIGEELLFRGWLLNEIGLVLSSLAFGLCHIPPNKDWLYWPAFAFVMGLALGAVCLWTNSLVYAIVIHAGINYLNIRLFTNRYSRYSTLQHN